jgi:hypothetical protein
MTQQRIPDRRGVSVAGQQDRPGAVETASGDLAQRMERLPPGHPSSPYDEDGTRKPAVTRPADRELPLPDERSPDAEPADPAPRQSDEPDQRSLDTDDLTKEPAESPPPSWPEAAGHEIADREPQASEVSGADDGTARIEPTNPDTSQPDIRSWWQVLPHLKEQWEHHKERWPQEQRPPVDRSTDEPGSWRGDSGRALSARDNAQVDGRCDRIAKAEALITSRVEDTERASRGYLAGKEFRLKERDRLKDKVATDLATNIDADLDEVVASVHDGVRYTLQYDNTEYTSGVQADVAQMKAQGFELIRLKNLWNDTEYKGINSQWRDGESGQAFEMQFHTRESFEAKQVTHKAYERLRNLQTTDDESGELRDYQREVSSKIPIPIDAQDIPEYP